MELFTDKRMRLPAVATGANAEKIMRRNFVVVGPTVLSMTFDQVSENTLINVVLWHVLLNLSLLITLDPVLLLTHSKWQEEIPPRYKSPS